MTVFLRIVSCPLLYSIRNIQSSKKITVAATGKDPATGKMKTEEYTVKGPVAVMITTTAAELEGETASRFQSSQ